ncbi:MAG: hypothetical protein H0X25_23470 [Acidobacteriales bacterium]|nr:hypothetical protein [Terriglobales bacterium]
MDLTGVVLFSGMMSWLAHLGGFGLILMGLADNSVVPMPGSMDNLRFWRRDGFELPHRLLFRVM